ncbi:unnamed protein product, partial [Cladocopium goreaui]
LLAAGFSVEQAAYYSQSYEKAKQRQQWLHAWDAARPCLLNGGAIDGNCAEIGLLATFLCRAQPLLAFRTEWCIWATEEKLAGCIDFAACRLQTYKYENPWHALAEPLEHLPEAQGVKYHLQLNIYRFILDKYYGHIVSSMLVVCLHPELQDGHWADVVPAMPAEICAIMQVRRDEVRRQCFWLHPVHCSESCYRIRCLPPLGR